MAPPKDDGLIEVESFTELPRLHHAAMEPHACVASYDPYQGSSPCTAPTRRFMGFVLW